MTWQISFTPRAEKELAAVDRPDRIRIIARLARLADDPRRARNVKALTGGGYRLRVGDWRVLNEIRDELLIVLVVKIGHRREVYRRD